MAVNVLVWYAYVIWLAPRVAHPATRPPSPPPQFDGQLIHDLFVGPVM
jgi:hypothetical protein